MCSSSTATPAHTDRLRAAASPGADVDEHRPQPLAAGRQRARRRARPGRRRGRPPRRAGAPRSRPSRSRSASPPTSRIGAEAGRACSPGARRTVVDRDDPAGGQDPADVAQAGVVQRRRPARAGRGSAAPTTAGTCTRRSRRRSGPSVGHDRVEPGPEEPRQRRLLRRRDLEHDDAAARAGRRAPSRAGPQPGPRSCVRRSRRSRRRRSRRRSDRSSALPHSQVDPLAASSRARARACPRRSPTRRRAAGGPTRRASSIARSPVPVATSSARSPGPTAARGRPPARASGGASRPS